MKLHYKGKYDLNPESLPHGEHRPGCVKFREAESTKALAVIGNGLCIVLIILLAIPVILRSRQYYSLLPVMLGCLLPMAALFPHEILHALCFRGDVYLYTNWKQGMLFVTGPETMSKTRFVFMSLCPNIVFGFIPYIIGLLFPRLIFFAVFGAICVGMGAGDYYNCYNALTQMPKGARTYLYGFNSYWYMP